MGIGKMEVHRAKNVKTDVLLNGAVQFTQSFVKLTLLLLEGSTS